MCGLVGIEGHPDASVLTALEMHAVQHRGQESCGIASYDGDRFHLRRAHGLVADTLNHKKTLAELPGSMAIGHVRYSTAGGSAACNAQPLYADLSCGGVAIAHNGNFTNANMLRRKLIEKGCIFQSTADTEVLLHLIALAKAPTVRERIIEALGHIEGAYSLVIATEREGLFAVRDPHGFRPLIEGSIVVGDTIATTYVSETVALDMIGAKFESEIAPGEIRSAREQSLVQFRLPHPRPERFCIFEYVYFARPDSFINGRDTYEVRKRLGAVLARQQKIEADLVVPVPDSGVPAALGYAKESLIDFELGIIRNHYVGRTFIEPNDSVRHLGTKLKHNANERVLSGKRVILVDDSVVRGTTSRKIVQMVRDRGATEVHLAITCPPIIGSCFYGIDTPERRDLMANKYSHERMRKEIGVETLVFLNLDGMYEAVTGSKKNEANNSFCDACWTRNYPTPLHDQMEKNGLVQ